jgi:hypothetical protein
MQKPGIAVIFGISWAKYSEQWVQLGESHAFTVTAQPLCMFKGICVLKSGCIVVGAAVPPHKNEDTIAMIKAIKCI